jgi:2-succinyl-5-enolpyruvyl-6-hydroxy-3-cyclohexene-1-carboxylate synthase
VNTQVQEAFRTPIDVTQKNLSTTYTVKMPSTAQRKLQAARENCQVTYKSKSIRIRTDLSAETLKARRLWTYVFQALKQNNY